MPYSSGPKVPLRSGTELSSRDAGRLGASPTQARARPAGYHHGDESTHAPADHDWHCRELAGKTRDIIGVVGHAGQREVRGGSLSVAAQVERVRVPAQITQVVCPEHPNSGGIGGAMDQDHGRPIAH
jgi:hypothetical protein